MNQIDHSSMNELMFELWIESQIDRIDSRYMADLITTEEYENLMKEVYNQEETFYTQLCS
jgi:hypothetical protein